jgi:hypothetical protein
MIDAKELRLGNYVSVTGYDYLNGNQVRMKISKSIEGIRQFGNDGASVYLDNNRLSCLNIRPVPLDGEILQMCGFEELGMYGNVYCRDNFRIHTGKDGDTGTVLFILYNEGEPVFQKEVSSLHQLQNLYFTLTGKDLDVNI